MRRSVIEPLHNAKHRWICTIRSRGVVLKLQLAAGRVPSRRGKPESDGGYKIYLTTQDRDQWVEFGGGGRRKMPNGLLPQKKMASKVQTPRGVGSKKICSI